MSKKIKTQNEVSDSLFITIIKQISDEHLTSINNFEFPYLVVRVVELLEKEKISSKEKHILANELINYFLEKMDFINEEKKRYLKTIIDSSIQLVIFSSKLKKTNKVNIPKENIDELIEKLYFLVDARIRDTENITNIFLSVCMDLIQYMNEYNINGRIKKMIVIGTIRKVLDNIRTLIPNINNNDVLILETIYSELPNFIDISVDLSNGKYDINKITSCFINFCCKKR